MNEKQRLSKPINDKNIGEFSQKSYIYKKNDF